MLRNKVKLYVYYSKEIEILEPDSYEYIAINYKDGIINVTCKTKNGSTEVRSYSPEEISDSKADIKKLIDEEYERQLNKLNEQPKSIESDSNESTDE